MGEHRRRFGAVVALAAGAFFSLALLPVDVTGPIGRALGPWLWHMLGAGAVGVPVIGFLLATAGFGRLPRLDMKRAAILAVGATILLPYLAGVILHVDNAGFTDPWSWAARISGWLPGFFAVSALDLIGTAGALFAGFVALTAVTLGTLAWHPLQRLERQSVPAPPWRPAPSLRPEPQPHPVPAIVPDEPAVRQEELFTPPRESRRRRRAEQREIDDIAAAAPPPADAEARPGVELLDPPRSDSVAANHAELQRLGELLLNTLRTFKVDSTLAGVTSGPTVTQFEVVPAAGVKAGRIVALADDLAITMRATSLRVAPIPGRGAVGVEVANPSPRIVPVRELLESDAWRGSTAMLPVALGRDLEGRPVVGDLARMPHLLVAGATGSGKSVAINTMITSLIYRYAPRYLRLLMIDPKMVELSMYNDLPHLRHPVVTDNADAAKVFKWAVYEMNRRYELLHANGARQLAEFNRKVREGKPMKNPGTRPTLATLDPDSGAAPEWSEEYTEGELPMIVLIVEELADLMMTVQGEIETPLAMLAQKARAIGIHVVLATQRPSVNVLTGLIKANFPSRIAFRVASKVDSRTIIDQNGAEALLGNGDMLFLPTGKNEPQRIQGAYISTEETERVMAWYASRREALMAREADILDMVRAQEESADEGGDDDASAGERDPLFRQAAETCVQYQGGSTSLLQRRLGVGYGRAARIIDQLHDAGVLGPPNGSRPREVLIGLHQLDQYV
ncbi:MAG: DNA translocase FtsK [Gemmatimonadales bacterium]